MISVKSGSPNLTGQLLLAHPSLYDPNFRRSIIYIARHDLANGAFGFILNRPLNEPLGSIAAANCPEELADIPLQFGGPVGLDNILFVSIDWDGFQRKLFIEYNTDPNDVNPAKAMALRGYAGWSEGQLEKELEENAWLVIDPSENGGLLACADSNTWKSLLSKISPELKLLAEMPDDPTLN